MAAPIGNKFYLDRLKDGREKQYKPEEIIPNFIEYANYVFDNPIEEEVIQKVKVSRDEEEIQKVKLSKMRTMSIGGFCVYLGITHKTFLNYQHDENNEYLQVILRVRDFIENYQLEGTAANQLNPVIMSRVLGLADKRESNITQNVKLLNIDPLDDSED